MGLGFEFECRKCGKKYDAYIGSGMLYPRVCRKLMKQVRAGKYGEEFQKLSNTVPYGTIDAGNVVYFCRECGKWEVQPILNFCEPSDPVYLQHIMETSKKAPCPCGLELKEFYRVIKVYYRYCSRCGSKMRRLKKMECRELPCPKCGEINSGEMVMWD